MEDIAPGLLEKIQKQFYHDIEKSSIVKNFKKQAQRGKISYSQANEVAQEIGKILAQSYSDNLSSGILPDGKMYYNIASRVLNPTLKEAYEMAADNAAIVQQIMNEAAGIGIKTIRAQIQQDNINGIVVADAAVELVNMTSNKLLEKYPDMNIQFGLHATSVNTRLDTIKKTDPRVTILWEDCGAFPFAYIPKKTDNFDDTKKFVEQIKNLRDAGFGCLFKGMTALDWSTFVHQKGRFVLGEESAYALYDKLKEKEKIWKYIQAYWISNIDYVADIVKMLDPDTLVGALVEDGLFDIKMWYPVALYSELLWNPFRSTREILSETALIPSVAFAGDDTI